MHCVHYGMYEVKTHFRNPVMLEMVSKDLIWTLCGIVPICLDLVSFGWRLHACGTDMSDMHGLEGEQSRAPPSPWYKPARTSTPLKLIIQRILFFHRGG